MLQACQGRLMFPVTALAQHSAPADRAGPRIEILHCDTTQHRHRAVALCVVCPWLESRQVEELAEKVQIYTQCCRYHLSKGVLASWAKRAIWGKLTANSSFAVCVQARRGLEPSDSYDCPFLRSPSHSCSLITPWQQRWCLPETPTEA